ncbi:MAG TPA: 4'-phosphopantetheinyl transferase superfamily protein [Candidatus Angelobacter sp.]
MAKIATPVLQMSCQAAVMTDQNQVDIWRIRLDVEGEGRHLRGLLAPEEIQRADRFRFENDRRRFVRARAAMRQILGAYIGISPQKIAFSYGAAGKPELAQELEKFRIRFNLSHSYEVALLAVTRGLVVGVDIELVNPEFAAREIAERFFSVNEVRYLLALPLGDRADAFFSCWTRKEAYIKALGAGLSVPLDSFEVPFGARSAPALLEIRSDPDQIAHWSMYDIDTENGYKAAVVVQGSAHKLEYREWKSEKTFVLTH